MAFGTLYNHNPSPRVFAILAVAKAHGLELDVVQADRHDGENYKKLLEVNPLGQVPTFVGADEAVLTESIAITLYITSQKPSTPLLGRSQAEYYQILQWMSFANSELMANIGGVILPLVGRYQPVRMDKEDCLRRFHMDCARLEGHLQESNRKYLVGDQLTIADLFTVGCMVFGVKVFYKVLLDKYPRMTSWFLEIHHLPIMKDVLGEFEPLNIPVPELKES